MIWLTWRQFRLQALVVLAAVAVMAVLLAITGPGLLHDYQLSHAGFLDRVDFDQLNRNLYLAGIVAVYATPVVIGAFWGAPLIARELESGTHRLVWNQSISRSRWLLAKAGLGGLAAMAVTGLLSLAVTWWSDPINDAINDGANSNTYLPRLFPPVFGARGVVPIGYAAFAFALGVAVGLVARRSVVAIAITLAAVIAVLILTPSFIRPLLTKPIETTVTLTADNMRGMQLSGSPDNPQVMGLEAKVGGPGDWKVSDQTVNSAGQVQKVLPTWVADCGPGPFKPGSAQPANWAETRQACFTRLATEGYRQLIHYYPAGRFWTLQWRETGFFLALALLLTGFSFWRIKRDLT
ncbi:MAG TPA: ABC transporter permease [Kribbella sp.]|jgi:ABC-type transport system involved in multi-copper enzyme maturation permease subunit